jgi:hypothetical protein
MLTIIEPKEHHLHQSKIDSLLSLLKIYQGFTPSSEKTENATFIVGEDKKQGVYGGAIVYSQNVRTLYHKLATPLLEFFPEKEQIWCVRFCFCADQDDRVLILETLELCEDFYVDLYKILVKLGQKKRTPFFALTLPHKEYRNTVTYGDWSYFLEVSPSDSSDYRFHGLLALKAKKEGDLEAKVSRDQFEDEDIEEAFFLAEEDDFDDQDQDHNPQDQTERTVQ